jgi:hypothetical protein
MQNCQSSQEAPRVPFLAWNARGGESKRGQVLINLMLLMLWSHLYS